MNITAYIDESGTHAGSETIAVAGFLGKPDEWGAFTVYWSEVLAHFGIPVFHMKDFAHRRSVFTGWTEDRRQSLLGTLLEVIDQHVLGSVGTVFTLRDYNAVFQGEVRRKTGGPYGLAMVMVVQDVAVLVRPLFGDPHVRYVLESGAEGFGQVAKAFSDNLRDPNRARQLRLLSLDFRSKADAIPLQAADLLAYELRLHLPRQLGIDKRPARYALRRIASMPRRWSRIEREELEKWQDVIELGLVHSTGSWRE